MRDLNDINETAGCLPAPAMEIRMKDEQQKETGQFLTFQLEEEVFALDINQIREVLEFNDITKIPQTPEMMRGVINLRGNVVPVIDLKQKFGMGRTEKTVSTCIIIIELLIEDEIVNIGALTDSVSEVINLSDDQVEPPPKIGNRLNAELLKGMGKKDGQFILILDIERIFSTDELSMVQEVTDATVA